MKINDLAEILGKSKEEVEAMLKEQDVIEIKLTEKNARQNKEDINIMPINRE